MSRLSFKIPAFWAAIALVASAPPAYAGVFGGPSNYTLKADIVQCVADDPLNGGDIPEDLADIPALENHPACGNLKAHILAHVELPLQNKRTQLWNNLKNITITGKTFAARLNEGKGFTFEEVDKPAQTLRIGVEVEAYLDASDRHKPMLSLLIKHRSVDNSAEEMVVTSDGKVYLNPYPREILRMTRIHTPFTPDRDDIWGGEGVFEGVAPANIPHLYPENARLWVSGKIEK